MIGPSRVLLVGAWTRENHMLALAILPGPTPNNQNRFKQSGFGGLGCIIKSLF